MSGPTQTPANTPATLQVRVAAKRTEAQDICSLELVAADGGALPAFTAGAHIDVHLPNGLVRQYSLSNAPSETKRYVIGVLRDAASRGGSTAVHDLVAEGSTLTISANRRYNSVTLSNNSTLTISGDRTVYVTGSINLSNSSQIVIGSGSVLRLYVDGGININNSAQ